MELSSLAAKQKRVKDWREGLSFMVQDESLRKKTKEQIQRLEAVLLRCWESQAITEKDALEIADLERQLERANELARVTVVPKAYSKSRNDSVGQ